MAKVRWLEVKLSDINYFMMDGQNVVYNCHVNKKNFNHTEKFTAQYFNHSAPKFLVQVTFAVLLEISD